MSISFQQDHRTKLCTEIRDAMLCVAFDSAGGGRPATIPSRDGEVAWKPTGRTGLARPSKAIATLLVAAGVPQNLVDNLAPSDLARIACGSSPADFGLPISAAEGHYNVTGTFSNIVVDAQNVLVRKGYEEAPTTFQLWAKQVAAPDFGDNHAIIGGEVGDPKAIGEDGEFEETTLTDGKEKFRLTVFGHVLSYTWQMMLNDRSGIFTDPILKMTRSMRRKQNRLVYGELKANRALADGIALFHASAVGSGGHANLSTGAISDYAVAVGDMVAKLAVQKGLGVDAGPLNLTGRHLLFPPNLQNKLATLIASGSVPGGTNDTANIYQGQFNPIMEAELATAFGGSDSAFYLLCDHADIDTVAYAYLNGFETPKVESMSSFGRLGMRTRIYQPFAVKPLDFRGMQMHTGA